MTNEYTAIETALQQLKDVIERESNRHMMDQKLHTSMQRLLEDEIIPQIENELDYDPTPYYLSD